MNILGINAYHGNSSAALVVDGRLVAAAEEERFNRVKYAAGFPARAIRYCLEEGGVAPQELDHIAVPRNPWARLARKLWYGMRMPGFAAERVKVLARFARLDAELACALDVDPRRIRARWHRVEHHQAHLASAFFVSPLEHAAVLSADGLGDFASTLWATGQGNGLQVLGAIAFPHSLGLYYTALTQYLGFPKYGDEYKVMGLAAYGVPAYTEEFQRIVRGKGLAFRLGLEYFLHHRNGAEMSWREADQTPSLGRLFSPQLEKRLGPARQADEPLEKRHRDIAATLQAALEEVLFEMLNALQKRTGQKAICLAGGVAFNCVANGKIFDRTPFTTIYVQPAAGDGGLALGAAYWVYHQILGRPREFVMDHAYWGPGFTHERMRAALASRRVLTSPFRISELPREEVVRATAQQIADGKVVGWFHGRMEWGPRALGNRSILADPRRAEMREILNQRIKRREAFRPFAPSILEEATGEYFERSDPSPFMTLVYPVRREQRAVIPAPTHVDGTGRLQTVGRQANPLYWSLIQHFEKLTGIPVVLNTSFNDNEPITCTPEEAVDCFLRTKMDVLVLGGFLIEKTVAASAAEGVPSAPLPSAG